MRERLLRRRLLLQHGVLECPIGGCSGGPTVIATGQVVPTAIAVDATSVYWAYNASGNVIKATPK